MKRNTVICILIASASTLGLVSAFIGKLASESSCNLSNSFMLGIYLGLGENAIESKQYFLGEKIFQEALTIAQAEKNNYTDLAESYTRIGQCQKRQKNPKKALESFNKAAALYERAEEGIIFNVDRRIELKCLEEYASLLRESGKPHDADLLAVRIEKLSKRLGPMEKVRQAFTEL